MKIVQDSYYTPLPYTVRDYKVKTYSMITYLKISGQSLIAVIKNHDFDWPSKRISIRYILCTPDLTLMKAYVSYARKIINGFLLSKKIKISLILAFTC